MMGHFPRSSHERPEPPRSPVRSPEGREPPRVARQLRGRRHGGRSRHRDPRRVPMNDRNEYTQDKDIVVNAANAGNFSTLTNALKAAGMMGTFKGIGPFTFFMPT